MTAPWGSVNGERACWGSKIIFLRCRLILIVLPSLSNSSSPPKSLRTAGSVRLPKAGACCSPQHSNQPELLPVPWGHQTQLALGRQCGEVIVPRRAGVQLKCHRAVFSTLFYGCCILTLLTGRTPNPAVCSPFLSFSL